jgi:Zn-finger nucleic acid-binding protein
MPLLMCPNDSSSMQTVQRGGVEFDMCPTCRGVWLDRGELEKLMSASRADDSPPREGERFSARPAPTQRRDYDDDDDHRGRRDQGEHRRRRGFDLFDIFD